VDPDAAETAHRATLEFSDFAWRALSEEAERQAVPLEELVAHAALYYLADLHSGRLAARVLRREEPAPPLLSVVVRD
jgi:hypothetical protein